MQYIRNRYRHSVTLNFCSSQIEQLKKRVFNKKVPKVPTFHLQKKVFKRKKKFGAAVVLLMRCDKHLQKKVLQQKTPIRN